MRFKGGFRRPGHTVVGFRELGHVLRFQAMQANSLSSTVINRHSCASHSELAPRLAGSPGPTWGSCAARSKLGPRGAPAPHAAAAAQQEQQTWHGWRRASAGPETRQPHPKERVRQAEKSDEACQDDAWEHNGIHENRTTAADLRCPKPLSHTRCSAKGKGATAAPVCKE
eukprot:6357625-Amphidinium_carterae.1